MRKFLLILLGIAAVGLVAVLLSHQPTPPLTTVPASPAPTAEIFSPSFWTIIYTTFNPFWVVLAAIVIVTALVGMGRKASASVVGVLAIVYAIGYFFHPAPNCASDDFACIRAQQETAADILAKHQTQVAEQERTQLVSQASRLVDPAYCSSQKVPHHYGTDRGEPVNKAGECFTDLWYKGHCVYAQEVNETQRLGPYCDIVGKSNPPMPADIEYAWSADPAEFDGFVRRSQPKYVSLFH